MAPTHVLDRPSDRKLAARAAASLPTLLVLATFLVLVGLPLLTLLYASFTKEAPRANSLSLDLTWEWYAVVSKAEFLDAAVASVGISVGGTIFALFIGVGLAWLVARTNLPMKWLAQLGGIVPFFLSAMVASIAWSYLASPRAGYLNLILADLGISYRFNIYTWQGMIFVFGICYAPYIFLYTLGSLSMMNPELEDAARSHVANEWHVFPGVTIPLTAPAILSGAVLCFALIVENFPVNQILGTPGGITTLPSLIYRLMNQAQPKPNSAAAVGMVLMAVVVIVIYFQRKVLGNKSFVTVSGKGVRGRTIDLGKWRWPFFALVVGYFIVAVLLPFAALAQMAMRKNPYIQSALSMFDPASLGFDSFGDVVSKPGFGRIVGNTLTVAGVSAVLGTALCFVLAVMAVQRTSWRTKLVDYLAQAPIAIPALVIGLGILWTWLIIPVPLYGTLAILIVAYIGRFIPQGYGGIFSAFRKVDRQLEEAALVSGATRWRTSLEISFPLVRTSVFSAALLLLVLSFRELTVAVFLFTFNTSVLSIYIFELWEGGYSTQVAAASLIYSGVLMIVVLAGRRFLEGPRTPAA